jgi:hypothetical protein
MLMMFSNFTLRELGLREALRILKAVIIVESALVFLRNPIIIGVGSILNSILGIGHSDGWVLTILELGPLQGDQEILGAQYSA